MKTVLAWFAVLSGVTTGAGAVGAGTVYYLDTRYWLVADQKAYELRQLQREAKRYELVCQETQNPTDCAYFEFLRNEIETMGRK